MTGYSALTRWVGARLGGPSCRQWPAGAANFSQLTMASSADRLTGHRRGQHKECETVNGSGSSTESKADRIGSAVFGALFVGVGALILLLTPADTLWHVGVALVCASLGLEAIASAVSGKRSLLSRIGPLP